MMAQELTSINSAQDTPSVQQGMLQSSMQFSLSMIWNMYTLRTWSVQYGRGCKNLSMSIDCLVTNNLQNTATDKESTFSLLAARKMMPHATVSPLNRTQSVVRKLQSGGHSECSCGNCSTVNSRMLS